VSKGSQDEQATPARTRRGEIPDMNARRPSAEVSAATRDDARRQRQTAYGS
jgi:hypothetical protein